MQAWEDTLIDKASAAVLWLRRQPVPLDVGLGPLGSGPAWHAIFKDGYAPLPFTGAVALERFLNKALSTMQRRQPDLAKISIADEPLVLTQSDMDPSNFAVDATGRPVIFDFCQIGWLPESLANFTLLKTSSIAGVSGRVFRDHLDSVKASSNLASMRAVMTYLVTGFQADQGLGLDKDGNVRQCSSPEQSNVKIFNLPPSLLLHRKLFPLSLLPRRKLVLCFQTIKLKCQAPTAAYERKIAET